MRSHEAGWTGWRDDIDRTIVAIGACTAVVVYLVLFAVVMRTSSYNVFAVMIVVPAIIAVTIPVIVRTARQYGERSLIGLLGAALLLKLLGAVIRYLVTFDVFSRADAAQYHRVGTTLSHAFRNGTFIVDVGGRVIGTHFIEIVTGVVYAIIGPTELGGFLVFSWLGFWGLYFLYRAFRMAMPNADHRRYALLVFFLPSLLFWPSSVGKESWMLFALGLTALGVAKLYAGKRGAYLVLGLGLLGVTMARPHIAVLMMVALLAGFMVRRGKSADALMRTGAKVIGIIVLVAAGTVVVANASAFLGVDNFDSDTLNQTLSSTADRTNAAQSAFAAPDAQSPTGFPVAVVTVLFRPFPFETAGLGGLIASAEGMVLLLLCLVSWRRLLAVPKRCFREPYVMMSTVFTLVFVFAFSNFSNFGILTRERTQVFPFFLVLLCVSARSRREQPGATGELPVAVASSAGRVL